MLDRIGGPQGEVPSKEAHAIVALTEQIFRHFRHRTALLPVFSDEALTRLTMPVLAILGGRDPFIDSRETRARLEAHVPRLTVRYLPDGRHFNAGQTDIVLRFLEGSASQATQGQ